MFGRIVCAENRSCQYKVLEALTILFKTTTRMHSYAGTDMLTLRGSVCVLP